jgi:hypothetical protein
MPAGGDDLRRQGGEKDQHGPAPVTTCHLYIPNFECWQY